MPRYVSVTLVISLVFVTMSTAAEYSGNTDFSRKYPSVGGEVNFPHGLHADNLSTTCNACHSALRTFGGISQIYGHKYCKFCHEKNNGPTECNTCHDITRKEHQR